MTPCGPAAAFSVVIPCYNESGYIDDCLESWRNQELLPREIVLVDNGSNDDTAGVARRRMAGEKRIRFRCLKESRPGKLHALAAGCRAAASKILVLADADTVYPPQYLRQAARLLAPGGGKRIAAMALPQYGDPRKPFSRISREYFHLLSRIFPRHTYTGGYGMVVLAEALERAGGFSEEIWPYVLMDHEIMVRVQLRGRAVYHRDFWCLASPRRRDRSRVRWTAGERLLYQFLPFRLHDWFFHQYLAGRFDRRGLVQERLREQPWRSPEAKDPS